MTDPVKKSWWKGAGTILVGLIAFGAAKGVVEGTINSRKPLTAESTRAALENDPQAGPIYSILKTDFPADYENVVQKILADERNHVPISETKVAIFWMFRTFSVSHSASIALAPEANLDELTDENLKLVRLLSLDQPDICARYVFDGLKPEDGDSMSPKAKSQIINVMLSQFRAMSAAKQKPQSRDDPTDGDWIEFRQTLETQNGPRSWEIIMADSLAKVSTGDQCRAGIDLYESLRASRRPLRTKLEAYVSKDAGEQAPAPSSS
jgi:hypothetical protein